MSSLRLFRFRAQSAMLVQPSPFDLVSGKSGIISILRTRSEKLLSLKANAKSESETGPGPRLPVAQSESMIVRGSKRSAFESLMPKNPRNSFDQIKNHSFFVFYIFQVRNNGYTERKSQR